MTSILEALRGGKVAATERRALPGSFWRRATYELYGFRYGALRFELVYSTGWFRPLVHVATMRKLGRYWTATRPSGAVLGTSTSPTELFTRVVDEHWRDLG